MTRGDPSEGALPHATFVAMLRGGALNKGELMAIGLLNTLLFMYSDKREIKGIRGIRGMKRDFLLLCFDEEDRFFKALLGPPIGERPAFDENCNIVHYALGFLSTSTLFFVIYTIYVNMQC